MANLFDNFNRSNGGVGASYNVLGGGTPQIVSNVVRSQTLNVFANGVRTETLANNQMVAMNIRTLAGAQILQAGIYLRNDGTSNNFYGFALYTNQTTKSEIFKIVGGSFTSLVSDSTVTWAANDTFAAYAFGSGASTALGLMRNGKVILTHTGDTSFSSGGAGFYLFVPTGGTIANLEIDNLFVADSAETFSPQLLYTDANGVQYWYIASSYNAPGVTVCRVLEPTSPTAGVPRKHVYLPGVLPDTDTVLPSPVEDYQDGLELARAAGYHNKFNATLICPTTRTFPWIADHPTDPNIRYESFYVLGLRPWIASTFGRSGDEHFITSFSKGGQGSVVLGMKWPDLFQRAGPWDQASDDDSGITGASFTSVHHPEYVYNNQTYYNANYSIDNNRATWDRQRFHQAPRFMFLSGDDAQFETYAAQLKSDLEGAGILFNWSVALGTVTHQWSASWIYRSIAAMCGLPVIVSVGSAGTGSGGTVAPGSPGGLANDIWVCVIHNSGQGALTMDAAWTELVQGNGGSTTSRLAAFYHRFDGTNTPTLTVTRAGGTGAQLQAGIFCVRGCRKLGSPASVVGSILAGTDVSMETTAITLPANRLNTLLVLTGAADDNAVTLPTDYLPIFNQSGPTNNYQGTAGTPDGMVSALYGFFGGGSISPTITQAAADPWASVLIALEPEEYGIYRRKSIQQAPRRASFF